jgi:hypothetical protein
LINIEKTVVEGAGATPLAAVVANKPRFRGRKIGLVLTGGNIDTRLLASVLTRELAREGRLSQLSIDLADRPGQLARVAALLRAGPTSSRCRTSAPSPICRQGHRRRSSRPRLGHLDGRRSLRGSASRSRSSQSEDH